MKKSFFYIVLAGLLWGTSGIFAPILSPYGFTAFQLATVRGTVSFLCLAIYALIRDRSLFRVHWKHLLLFFGIGVSVFLTAAFYYYSMQLTSVSTSVVLLYMAPVYVSIVSAIFFGERFSKMKVLAMIGMLVGCCLVSGIIGGMKFDPIGLLFAVLSGVAYATYNILTKIAMRWGCVPVTVTLYGFLFMSLVGLCTSHPAGIVTGVAADPARTLPLLIGMGLCTCVLPYFLYTLAIRRLPAGTASALGIIEPMSATLYSILIFHERPGLFSYIGILLILLAVVGLGIGARQDSPSHATAEEKGAYFSTQVSAQIKLAHRIKIHRLYRRAFPRTERKPFSIIRSMQRKGKTDVWYFEKDGVFVGFATTINGNDRILLDYLAVVEKERGKGIGTEMLKLLRAQYAGKGVFLEIEKLCAEAPNAEERKRRKQFYLSCGMKELNVSVRLFGVEMELLGWDCAMNYEEYRSFYRDNYSEFAAEHIQRCDGDPV